MSAVRALAALALVASCRYSLEAEPDAPPKMDAPMNLIDAGPSPSCIEARTHSDLDFIEDTIFKRHCLFNACHNSDSPNSGSLDLRAGISRAELLDVDATTDDDAVPAGTYKLVVANQPTQSYLLFKLRHFTGAQMSPPAGEPGPMDSYMPQSSAGTAASPLCLEKREAIERWINAGAPPRTTPPP